MDKKTVKLILNILKNVISIVLVIAATVSMLGATLINVGRDYLQSEEFNTQIDETDLSAVKFVINNNKVTVLEYVRGMAALYLDKQLPSFFPYGNYAIDAVITPQLVDTTIKAEVRKLLDYFLNTSVDEAQNRIDNNITLEDNEELNPQNAENIEEALSAYARGMVLGSIEGAAKMSTDELIILVSQETVTKLSVLAAVLIFIVVLLNLGSIFNNLIYGGAMGLLYGIVIKVVQGKFEDWNTGIEDLVGYVFLKPLADTYSTNAIIGIIIGVLLIALYVGIYFLFKNSANKEQESNQ